MEGNMRVKSFLVLVLLVSLAGCSLGKLVGTGALNDPLAQTAGALCEGNSQVQGAAEKVAAYCGPNNVGVVAAVRAASTLIELIWPDVKAKLDGAGVCVAAPQSEACKRTWLVGFPGALCAAVIGCAQS